MHPYLQNIAIIAYVCAMGLALAHLVQRQAYVHRLAVLATLVGWIAHTLALVVLAIEIGGPPLGTLPNAVSVVVWVVVLLEMLVERQSGVTVLGAFVLPVVVVLSLKSSVARPVTLAPALGNAWIWIHIALALVGIAAFVLNFAGAIMYLRRSVRSATSARAASITACRPSRRSIAGHTARSRSAFRSSPRPDPRRRVGAHRVGQRLCVRPAGLLLAGGLADLRRHPGGRAAGGWHGRPRGVTSPSSASRRSWSRSVPGSFCPDGTAPDALFAAGISHKNAPLALREQLAADEGKVREILRDLVGGGVLREAVILSTCNRVEVYGVADVPGERARVAFRHLCRQRGVEVTAVEEVLYTHAEDDAIRHAFRVASSLDSMMIASRRSSARSRTPSRSRRAARRWGRRCTRSFTQAFAVAKRVRTETEIARHAVSISFAAVRAGQEDLSRGSPAAPCCWWAPAR